MKTGVLGHVEWVEFLRVPHVPRPGETVHATESYRVAGGGGAVAAVQLHKLAGNCLFYTAFGDDRVGRATRRAVAATGVEVASVWRPPPARRAVTHVDSDGERTITVIGDRLSAATEDPLPWDRLEGLDCVYVTSDDPGTTRAARAARVLVATARVLPSLRSAGVYLDAVVASATDESERYSPGDLDPAPGLVALTEGGRGGRYLTAAGDRGRWDPAPVPGPVVDRYGAGDSFAAGLTYALGLGYGPREACALAARCGAAVLAGRGPYESQLTAAGLDPSP